MAIIKKTVIINVGENVKKSEPQNTAVEKGPIYLIKLTLMSVISFTSQEKYL